MRLLALLLLTVSLTACCPKQKEIPVSDDVCKMTCEAWPNASEVTIYGRRCTCAEHRPPTCPYGLSPGACTADGRNCCPTEARR